MTERRSVLTFLFVIVVILAGWFFTCDAIHGAEYILRYTDSFTESIPQPGRCMRDMWGRTYCQPQPPKVQQVSCTGSAACVGYLDGRTIIVTAAHNTRQRNVPKVDGVSIQIRTTSGDVAICEAEGTSYDWLPYPLGKVPVEGSTVQLAGYGPGRRRVQTGRVVASKLTDLERFEVTPGSIQGDSGGPVVHEGTLVGIISTTDGRLTQVESSDRIRNVLLSTYGRLPTLKRGGDSAPKREWKPGKRPSEPLKAPDWSNEIADIQYRQKQLLSLVGKNTEAIVEMNRKWVTVDDNTQRISDLEKELARLRSLETEIWIEYPDGSKAGPVTVKLLQGDPIRLGFEPIK